MNRNELKEKLLKYYENNGLFPDNRFNCRNKLICEKINQDKLSYGQHCHLGPHYGENYPKILVVSLDCGAGRHDTIDNRTQEIIDFGGTNPHMKGTITILNDLLGMQGRECLKYFAMTNACKCSHNKVSNQLLWKYYDHCIEHKIAEIEILNPDIIYFQGNNALIGLNDKLTKIENIPQELSYHIRNFNINGKQYLSVSCIHPSARGRNAKKRNEFYYIENSLISKINNYIKSNNLLNVIKQ